MKDERLRILQCVVVIIVIEISFESGIAHRFQFFFFTGVCEYAGNAVQVEHFICRNKKKKKKKKHRHHNTYIRTIGVDKSTLSTATATRLRVARSSIASVS
jgi:archaellum biogenesis protein FlaJ (TadC family)